MRRIPPVGVILLFLGSVFAGCVGGGATDSAPSGPESVEDTGAGLRGIVVSDELFPVAEAQVAVHDGPSAVTDAAGKFELANLRPGTQTLNVSAEGYEPATQEAEVPLEGFAEVQIVLKGIPGKSPYFTTIIFEGFDACSISLVYSAGGYAPFGPVPCPFGQRKAVLKTEVGPDWKAGVHELVWKTSEEMIFASSVSTSKRPGVAGCRTSGSSHDWCPALTWGRSPIRIFARINSHDLNLTEDWAYFVVQIVWQSSESFWVSINTKGAGCTTGAPCPGVEISRSPLRVDGAPEDAAIAKRYALDGKKTYAEGKQGLSISTLYAGLLREEINSTAPAVCVAFWGQFGVASRLGCPLGFGYSTGIRFKQYVSIFHWERPLKPSEYSALPDA